MANRTQIGQRQAELVAALLRGAPAPENFDSKRLALATAALRRKRSRSIAKAWPQLAASLGDRLPAELNTHFDSNPGPPPGGALADGRDLARSLAAERRLAWEGRRELMVAEAVYRWRAGELPRPRTFGVRIGFRGAPFRFAIALRCPGLGVRVLLIQPKPS